MHFFDEEIVSQFPKTAVFVCMHVAADSAWWQVKNIFVATLCLEILAV